MEFMQKDMLVEFLVRTENSSELLKLEIVNKSFQTAIRETNWMFIPHTLVSDEDFANIICVNNIHFGLNLAGGFLIPLTEDGLLTLNDKITDDNVKFLSKCHSLNLSGCQITDEGAKYLGNCHTLNLSGCQITDEGAKYLENCHTLNLSGCQITDEGAKYLGNCRTLNFSGCQITDEGAKYLGNSYIKFIRMSNHR
jgi:Leucine-rich repeat (LRR) protein